MPLIGDMSDPVGLAIQLGVVGPVPTRVGQNILCIIGTSTHGPAMTPLALTNSQQVGQYYKGGDLYYQGTLAFGQGVTTVYFMRVLGDNYAAASVVADDGLSSPTDTGTFIATSDGITGNSAAIVVADGTFNAWDASSFAGDGTVGPYDLRFTNYVTNASPDKNWVKVGNVAKTIVYSEGDLAAGKVWVDGVNGTLEFFAGEEPQPSDAITFSIQYKTKKVTIKDGDNRPVTIDSIRDQVQLEAALMYSDLVNYEPNPLTTHLPANGTYELDGGSDGDPITTSEWLEALQVLMFEMEESGTGCTAVALTQYEVDAGTYDLIPVLDGWLTEMEANFMPCLGFVGMPPNIEEAEAVRIASNFNNRLLSIVVNPWDQSAGTRRNGAVARGAMEARVALGESAAKAENSMRAMNGLLNTYRKPTVKTLHNNGLDVLVKRNSGIVPYMGRSTAFDWAYIRCVDNRTVNAIIVALKYVTDQFYFRKNTPSERDSLRRSIKAVLDEQVALENVRAYTLRVERVRTDPNRVNIYLQMENIGHMEFFFVKFDVGILDLID